MTETKQKVDPCCIVMVLTADKLVDALKAMQIARNMYVTAYGRDKFTNTTEKRIGELIRELQKVGIDAYEEKQ